MKGQKPFTFVEDRSTALAFPIGKPTEQPIGYSSAATKYSPGHPVLFPDIFAISQYFHLVIHKHGEKEVA